MTLQSVSMTVPKPLLEEVFGRTWQRMRPLLRYIRALEADRATLMEHYRSLHERALELVDEVENRDGRIAQLEARLSAIRCAVLSEATEEQILLAGP